ncbi:MAG: glycosyltransferase [Bryobacteraceae bacterium]|nr:glycosyltransferase [Bryobacteraceae bacterium]MDW8378992.1 glycosyltransferase [Bryobacterales bacterium]
MNSASAPRVAFFSDSFYEVNGVAHTSRQFQNFAERRQLPFFSLHVGPKDSLVQRGPLTIAELSISRVSFPLETDMRFDLLALQHRKEIREQLKTFQPDFIHITGPGHIGILGAILAHDLKIPLVASWHTNLHEFGARRLERLLSFVPGSVRRVISRCAESSALACCVRFYRIARKLLAPNPDLVRLLHERTGKPTYPMGRGVDIELFHPKRRTRTDDAFVLGYVGRLTPEKNVRLLARIEEAIQSAGLGPYRFLIVGQGSEQDWLRRNLHNAEFTGVLRGEALAEAYANMDLFVFPSTTDTYGNVIQESLASGVPAIVTPEGGPKYLVRSGETGLVAASETAFIRCVLDLMRDRQTHAAMRAKARQYSCGNTWDRVFERVYEVYAA